MTAEEINVLVNIIEERNEQKYSSFQNEILKIRSDVDKMINNIDCLEQNFSSEVTQINHSLDNCMKNIDYNICHKICPERG